MRLSIYQLIDALTKIDCGLHTESGLRLRTGYDSVTDALSVPTVQRLP